MTEGIHGTKCNMRMRNDDEDEGGFSERLPPMTHEFLHPGTGPNRTEETAECANSATGRMNPPPPLVRRIYVENTPVGQTLAVSNDCHG